MNCNVGKFVGLFLVEHSSWKMISWSYMVDTQTNMIHDENVEEMYILGTNMK